MNLNQDYISKCKVKSSCEYFTKSNAQARLSADNSDSGFAWSVPLSARLLESCLANNFLIMDIKLNISVLIWLLEIN